MVRVGRSRRSVQNMRSIFILLVCTTFSGCRQEEPPVVTEPETEASDQAQRPPIRIIRFYGTNKSFGIELNGERAFLTQNTTPKIKLEIPFDDGLSLLEGFYKISGIERYRGSDDDERTTSIQYLIHIYDEMADRKFGEWVDYIVPKDRLSSDPELVNWFERMRSLRDRVNSEPQR